MPERANLTGFSVGDGGAESLELSTPNHGVDSLNVANAATALAQAQLRLDDRAAARSHLERALAVYERENAEPELSDVRELIAHLAD